MYRMAAYCRLSKEDGENRVSESIENQVEMIREYVNRSPDLEIAEFYIDDGYSGLYFTNRPEFQRMMEDICQGKIQGVITKDISRLGREHIETSNYMERVFPTLGIRYIAILDGVDSVSHANEELALFKTLFNDMYSRDISKKIRGALLAQKRRGQFMSGFAPYGYIRDREDKHHFLEDPEAAQVVRRIFSLYLSGCSMAGIAEKLNEEDILSPSEYKRRVQGLMYSNAREKAGKKGWTYPTVRVILRNRAYTGAMVQHKTEKISYKIDKCRYIPEEEQYIVEGMHEAIISRETFEQAQELMKKRVRTSARDRENAKENVYGGILICGECGYPLQRVDRRDGYECGTYHRRGNTVCCSHFIKREILDSVIKNELQRQMKKALKKEDEESLLRAADQSRKRERQGLEADGRRQRLEAELLNVLRYQKKIYEDHAAGILTKEEYIFYRGEYKKQNQEIQRKIRKAEEKRFGTSGESGEHWIEKFIKSGAPEDVRRELAVQLIDKIVVSKGQRLDIIFKYRSPYPGEKEG